MSVRVEYKQEDLVCCVCYEDLCDEIHNCSKGQHFLCGKCSDKIKGKCPICGNTDNFIRNLMLEQEINKHIVNCPKNCGVKIFTWNNDHRDTCINADIDCVFCKHKISNKCSSFLKHAQEFCQIQFDIRSIQIQKHKIKYTADEKPTILIINNKLALIVQYKKESYIFRAISDDSEIISTQIVISTEGKISSQGEFMIGQLRDSDKKLEFHKSLGAIFILDFACFNKPPVKNNVSNNNNNNNTTNTLQQQLASNLVDLHLLNSFLGSDLNNTRL